MEKKSSVVHDKNSSVNHNDKINISEKKYPQIFIVLSIILILIVTFNIIQTIPLGSMINGKIVEAKEAATPAKIQLITINNQKCADCVDISLIVDSLKKSNVNITEEKELEFNSQITKEIIDKYNIESVPTIIISGEIDKLNIKDMEKIDNVLIFSKLNPPYTETKTGKTIGLVYTTLIKDSSCTACRDLSSIPDTLTQSGVVVKEEKMLEKSDTKAQEWIKKLNIQKLPVFLISDDIEVYPFVEKMKQAKIPKKNGYYIFESLAPYAEVNTGKIRGLVDLTMISDTKCTSCYDVNIHKQIFSQIGFAILNEKIVDINSVEGVKLKNKYLLEKVPTVILTGDLNAYTDFEQLWQQVGTIEDDGTYILRNVGNLGEGIIYHDLNSDKIIGETTTVSS